MKKLLILLCCLLPMVLQAQIITTVAGTTTGGSYADGIPATSAALGHCGYIAFDGAGNYYFGSHLFKVRKVSTSGIITTVAGTGISGFSGDGGPATAAQISLPGGIAFDHLGNLYIPDIENNRIRKVDMVTGIINSIAGSGIAGFSGDGGPATSATIYLPWGVTFDANRNLYFIDGNNNRIRKIDTNGIIKTIAGNGGFGSSGDGGPATAAEIANINGINVDVFNNLYVATTEKIRKINLSTGKITTVAGNGISGYSGDGGPATTAKLLLAADVASDKHGNFYFSELYNHIIRKVNWAGYISTIVGNNIAGYSGDGGPATTAQLNLPRGITLDSCGNLFISDAQNGLIRKVTFPKCHYLDVEEMAAENKISIYPNPTNHLLHIDNLQTNAGYRILSIVGAAIQQGRLRAGNNELNIRDLPPGMYLLEVNENGKKATYKVAKQ